MKKTFSMLVGGCVGGILTRTLFDFGIVEMIALSLLCLCLLCVWLLIPSLSFSGYVALFFCAWLLGTMRTEFAFHQYEAGKVYMDGERYKGEGVVDAEPDVRDEYTILYVRTLNDAGTRLRVKTPHHPHLSYGERVHVAGVLVAPTSFQTDTGREFNYAGFLMKDGVHYDLREGEVVSLGGFSGSRVRTSLIQLKTTWLGKVSESMSEPSASLLGGVTVGAKRSLGEEWLQAFRDTGLIHIVVLSGYNLTLVANSMVRATASFPLIARVAFGSIGVLSFAVLVGGGATVVRASIMAVLGMLAPLVRRPYLLLRALFLAGLFMIMWNPFSLLFDAGFQLSFVATAGLILIAPLFEKYLPWIPLCWGMRGIVSATFATQLAVLPLLLYHIGEVSLVAPLVNVLVLPLVPLVMATGALTGFLGMLHTLIALPFAVVSYAILSYTFIVVETFSRFPFATLTVPVLPWHTLLFLYGGVMLLVFTIKTPADEAGEKG